VYWITGCMSVKYRGDEHDAFFLDVVSYRKLHRVQSEGRHDGLRFQGVIYVIHRINIVKEIFICGTKRVKNVLHQVFLGG